MSRIDPDLILNGHVPDPSVATVWTHGVQIAGPGTPGAEWDPETRIVNIEKALRDRAARVDQATAELPRLALAVETTRRHVEAFPLGRLTADLAKRRSQARIQHSQARGKLAEALRKTPGRRYGCWRLSRFDKLTDREEVATA